MPMKTTAPNLAVLVDADNAQATAIEGILEEVAKYGAATVKRAYGDWTTQNLTGWKKVLHVHAVQPVQQFSYTTGKNATDSALIIDAMDLLHGGRVDGFCLVSSDSDFTRLATRIREAGLAVYGFGEEKTPKPFVAACDRFIFTEILGDATAGAKPGKSAKKRLQPMLSAAITAVAQEDGWSNLGAVGSLLNKNDPSFDSRNYGYRKLGDLVREQSCLDIEERRAGDNGQALQIYVRLKEA